MGYLDPDRATAISAITDQLSGAPGLTTYPSGAAAANGVSMAEVIRYISDQLSGTAGVPTYPAAAAPANGVSLAEVLSAQYEHLRPKTIVGTTDIDDSVQTETTPYVILTIAPTAGAPMADVEVIIDLAKATTGFAAVETSITVQLAIARKVDGTNWRREAYNEAALSGTNAANRCQRLQIGSVGVTESVAIFAVFSSDVTSDMELPYIINYKGLAAPTVTEVAA